jgi:hypothetical protein
MKLYADSLLIFSSQFSNSLIPCAYERVNIGNTCKVTWLVIKCFFSILSQVYKGDELYFYVDGLEVSKANWMRFVNPAYSCESQNLIACQYKVSWSWREWAAKAPTTVD